MMSVLHIISILVTAQLMADGLLHPGGTGPTVEEQFQQLQEEIRQNFSTLQQKVFASETQALRQILNQEKSFREELEKEVNDLKTNFTAQEHLLIQEMKFREKFEQDANNKLQNLSIELQSIQGKLDNYVHEQQQMGLQLGVSILNTKNLTGYIDHRYNQLSSSLSQAERHLDALNITLLKGMTSMPVGTSHMVAFTAYARMSKSSLSNEIIIFDTIITNEGSGYSASTGIFTCPLDGTYAFTWTHLIHAGHYCHAYLYKNGASQKLDAHSNLQGMSSSTIVYTMATMSGTLHLSRGDRVWIHSNACETFMSSPYNSFSGWKL